MFALLVMVLLSLAAVVAAGLGWAADTRDPEYSMGRVLGHRPWKDEHLYPNQSSTRSVGDDRPSERAAG